ncbi:MAG TPA: hypothetical protein VFG20_12140 [Planctomycetaceae bacterium]|nr:hypothetical protein [Planctomycetaceae bacterium]
MLCRLALMLLVLGAGMTASAQEYVNGYTYVAPSYYLTPPVVTYSQGYVGAPYYAAQPAPGFVAPGPVVGPAPIVYRGRVRPSQREVEYRFRGIDGRRHKVEVEYDRYGRVKDVDYRR